MRAVLVRRGELVRDPPPSNVRIGKGALIDDDVRLGSEGGGAPVRPIDIGRDARIRGGSAIDAGARIGDRLETGRNVCIGEDTVIGADRHIRNNTVIEGDCVVGDHVRIAANCYIARFTTNATILPFVTVGERSVVGAGSVVTRDVAAELVVAGNPARVLKSISEVVCPLDLEEGDYLKAATHPDSMSPGPRPSQNWK
ncbi:MAG: hypothetical protein E6J38_06440 [Chloroflexi bacterium]|nr:MAG: hypothetical protein E6J38_06440 [Chloroflexota bacterium]